MQERYCTGYLKKQILHRRMEVDSETAVTVSDREFQWLSHLPVTGRLDSATLGKMAAPRCGVKDSNSHRTWAKRVNAVFTGGSSVSSSGGQHLRKKRYTQTGEWWA